MTRQAELSAEVNVSLEGAAPDGARGENRRCGPGSAIARMAGCLYSVDAGSARRPAGEGLRGLAVLLVFFVHYDALFGDYAPGGSLAQILSHGLGTVGNAGVDVFFVLSGYLIYGMLIRSKRTSVQFLRRRIERIYPAFLVVLLVYLVLSAFLPQYGKLPGSISAATLYILQNVLLMPGVLDIRPIVTVTWSLSYEFAFYLAIPLVIWSLRMRQWSRGARIVFFILLSVSTLIYSSTVARSHCRLLMFVPGIVLFELLQTARVRSFLERAKESFDWLALLSLLAGLAFAWWIDTAQTAAVWLPRLGNGRTILPGVRDYQGPYKVVTLAPVLLLFIMAALGREGAIARGLSWKPIRYLGNMSYSYFLLHGLTLHGVAVTAAALLPAALRCSAAVWCALLPVGFAATLVSSTVLFALVERPLSVDGRLPWRRLAGAKTVR